MGAVGEQVLNRCIVHHPIERGNPNDQSDASLTEIASLLDQGADNLAAKLQSGGFKVASTAQSIEEIAARNGAPAPELMHLLFE